MRPSRCYYAVVNHWFNLQVSSPAQLWQLRRLYHHSSLLPVLPLFQYYSTIFLLRLLPNQEVRARRDYYYSTTTFLLRLLPKQEVRARRDYHYSITDSTTATTQVRGQSTQRSFNYKLQARAQAVARALTVKPVPKQWPELYQSSN